LSPGEERRKALEAAIRAALPRLLEGLSGKDDVRRAALDSVRRLGKKILPALIAELEEGPKSPQLVLEAGSAITGLPNEAGPGDLKTKAAAWRAWLEH